jgi:hypothetical protein
VTDHGLIPGHPPHRSCNPSSLVDYSLRLLQLCSLTTLLHPHSCTPTEHQLNQQSSSTYIVYSFFPLSQCRFNQFPPRQTKKTYAFFALSCTDDCSTTSDILCYQCNINQTIIHLEDITEAPELTHTHLASVLNFWLAKYERKKLCAKNHLCSTAQTVPRYGMGT